MSIETEFGDMRRGPGDHPPRLPQMPPEVEHAKMLAQHASQVLSDMLRGGFASSGVSAAQTVESAFAIADQFDKEFQKRMNTAVNSISPIQKPPPGLILK